MLPRYYDPSEGEILIDGINIRQLKLHDLRKLFGVVSQESILFNDTVFNNIAFGLENVREEDVIGAAKTANAHDFIMEMPEKYDTNIGDRGSKLSGGQRQRISIARAVLKNPSALDSESERLVQESLLRLIENRTSIVIAHRLSTIMHADEIIVLQRGEIIERGTHGSLLNNGSAYKKLYDLQAFV
jgi:ABC-type multidrug transport system fused ATPase/permease subunit